MDPLQYQEMLEYSQQNSKLRVSVNQSGNVVMVPVNLEENSPTDSLSHHVTTHIITPEQLEHDDSAGGYVKQSGASSGGNDLYDSLGVLGTDENLADLQPEDSDEEEGEGQEGLASLTPEQQKLEFMAALNLVPPAVLEEIQRRQRLCRAEYGNWWDRQHSTDFCLVPKANNTFNRAISEDPPQSDTPVLNGSYPLMIAGEDQTQVAAGPDAESMVEQITYLTSWPATSSSPAAAHQANTIEIVTTPTTATSNHTHHLQHMGVDDGGYQITFQAINEYSNPHHTHHH